MVEIKDVAVSFGGKMIFENINLKIERGEKILITGRSGSGKSTILKTILGFILPEKGTMVDYLVKDGRKSRAMVVDAKDPRAKKAELSYRILDEIDNMHLVDVDLHTGRFHQIRCQFARRSAPILGDVKYGGYNTGRNLALCAYRLSLKSPETGEYVTFQVMPKGKDFNEFSYFRNQD